MFGNFGEDLMRFIVIACCFCFALGVAVAYGLPALWNFVKPFIHQWTA